MSAITWKDAELRRRDIIDTIVMALVLVELIVTNAIVAWNRSFEREAPRLRIAAVAARPLKAGTVLAKNDVAVRIRGVEVDELFDRPEQLVGRQLSCDVGRNDVIKSTALIDGATRTAATFDVVVDEAVALHVKKNDRILLARNGETQAPNMAAFTVVDEPQTVAAEKDGTRLCRLVLSTNHAIDAMRVIGAAKDGDKFVPLILKP